MDLMNYLNGFLNKSEQEPGSIREGSFTSDPNVFPSDGIPDEVRKKATQMTGEQFAEIMLHPALQHILEEMRIALEKLVETDPQADKATDEIWDAFFTAVKNTTIHKVNGTQIGNGKLPSYVPFYMSMAFARWCIEEGYVSIMTAKKEDIDGLSSEGDTNDE